MKNNLLLSTCLTAAVAFAPCAFADTSMDGLWEGANGLTFEFNGTNCTFKQGDSVKAQGAYSIADGKLSIQGAQPLPFVKNGDGFSIASMQFKKKGAEVELMGLFNAPAGGNAAPAAQPAAAPQGGADGKTVTVEVTGMGTDKMDALKNAWLEAVRSAVGSYSNGRENLINDELTEQIATYSRGKVNSYKVLKEQNTAEGYSITISAVIEKDVLEQMKTTEKKMNTSSADLSALRSKGAANISAKQQSTDLAGIIQNSDVLDNISDLINYKMKILTIDDKYVAMHILTLNEDNYYDVFKPRVEKFVMQFAKGRKSANISNDNNYRKFLKSQIDFMKNLDKWNPDDNEKKIILEKMKNGESIVLRPIQKCDSEIKEITKFDMLSIYEDDYRYVAYKIPKESIIPLMKKFIKKRNISFKSEIMFEDKKRPTVFESEPINFSVGVYSYIGGDSNGYANVGGQYVTFGIKPMFFLSSKGYKIGFLHNFSKIGIDQFENRNMLENLYKEISCYISQNCRKCLIYYQILDVSSDEVTKIKSVTGGYELN